MPKVELLPWTNGAILAPAWWPNTYVGRVAVERISGTSDLVCPLCGGGVTAGGCARCHLSLSDVSHRATRRSGSWPRSLWLRSIGLVAYAGIAAWSWYFMPTSFLFVLPGAIVGAYFQVVRGRPVLAAALCFTIVVIVPALLWSAGLTGAFADITGGH